MTTAHPPQTMIADYAAGTLSRGMALAVAGHLSLCRRLPRPGRPPRDPLRRDLRELHRARRAVGALPRGRARPPRPPRRARGADARRRHAAGAALPLPLRPAPRAALAPATRPASARCRLEGFPSEEVGLVRAEPGTRVPAHGHAGPEATLVLEGGLRDGGRTYRRGDIAFCDETVEHSPEVAGSEACLYLVVASAPSLHAA